MGEDEEELLPVKRWGPVSPGTHTLELTCPACDQKFVAGDYTALVAIGPGADKDGRENARQGRAYNAHALVLHYACHTGIEDTTVEVMGQSGSNV